MLIRVLDDTGLFPESLNRTSFHDRPRNDCVRIRESKIKQVLQILRQLGLAIFLGESSPDFFDQTETVFGGRRIAKSFSHWEKDRQCNSPDWYVPRRIATKPFRGMSRAADGLPATALLAKDLSLLESSLDCS